MSLKLTALFRSYNMRSLKAELTAAFAGVPLDVVPFDEEAAGPSFALNCHPLRRTPVLETPEGYIFESTAIVRHIARVSKDRALYGATAFEASCCDMWVEFAAGEIDAHTFKLVLNKFHPEWKVDTNEAEKGTIEALDGLEKWLETRTFLVGERLSIADIAIATSMWGVLMYNPQGEALHKTYKACARLYNTVMQQPEAVEALKRAGTSFVLPANPKEEKSKDQKPKVEQKPKEQKPPAPADDEEDDAPKEEKKPNPLDSLPPSKFVLDAFKREYSNNDTRTVAAPYFFANFDPEGFSCFWCKYKYNDENKMQFMTANFIRGWFQRMEHTRKYAFGVALISGEDKSHEVSALWVFRGKGIPQIVLDVEDTELFTWTAISDIQAEAAQITDYLCWEGPTIPRPVLEGRTFK